MDKLQWHLWRHAGIGASDAASLHNSSPYKTYAKLLREKQLAFPIVTPPSWPMIKGIKLEPILRKRFCAWWENRFSLPELNTSDPFNAINLEHPEHPFIRASLDGLSLDGKTLVEIKYVGQKTLGTLPHHHYIQIQHQLIVSGAKEAYCAQGDGNTFNVIPVPKNEAFCEFHLTLCKAFWEQLKGKTAEVPLNTEPGGINYVEV